MEKFKVSDQWKRIRAIQYDGTLTSINDIKKMIHDDYILDIYSIIVKSGDYVTNYSDSPKAIYFTVRLKCDENLITVRQFGMNLGDYFVKSEKTGLMVIPGMYFNEIYRRDTSPDDKETSNG